MLKTNPNPNRTYEEYAEDWKKDGLTPPSKEEYELRESLMYTDHLACGMRNYMSDIIIHKGSSSMWNVKEVNAFYDEMHELYELVSDFYSMRGVEFPKEEEASDAWWVMRKAREKEERARKRAERKAEKERIAKREAEMKVAQKKGE